MASNVEDALIVKELVGVKFAMNTKVPQAQTSGAGQGAPAAYVTGAFGLNSDANMLALYNLVVEIRATLVANGMMKGSA